MVPVHGGIDINHWTIMKWEYHQVEVPHWKLKNKFTSVVCNYDRVLCLHRCNLLNNHSNLLSLQCLHVLTFDVDTTVKLHWQKVTTNEESLCCQTSSLREAMSSHIRSLNCMFFLVTVRMTFFGVDTWCTSGHSRYWSSPVPRAVLKQPVFQVRHAMCLCWHW